jgi:hypothetical protein
LKSEHRKCFIAEYLSAGCIKPDSPLLRPFFRIRNEPSQNTLKNRRILSRWPVSFAENGRANIFAQTDAI